MTRDEQHLRLLVIFHYIVAGLTALVGCFPVIHFAVGFLILFAPAIFETKGDQPPAWFGLFFMGLAGIMMTLFWAMAGVIFAAGRFLAARTHYWFCLIVAGFECCLSPFGTVLGIFTILVLVQDSVREMFGVDRPSPAIAGGNPFGPVQP